MKRSVATACALLLALPALAERPQETIAAKLKLARPDIQVERVVPTEVSGLYRVELGGEYGQQFLHMTADGRHLIVGDLFEVEGSMLTNVSDRARQGKRRELMATVPVDEMIVFSPPGKPRATINVFTDVDCGYCQKLHSEMAELNAHGIEVRYLAYPRSGVGSESYDRIVSAWCADDPNAALTALKARREVPERTCDNPVARQYQLGRQVGIAGTPAILLESGELIPGYLPAAELEQRLGL
jgi:thiol:disulfide interchange protein DsbC